MMTWHLHQAKEHHLPIGRGKSTTNSRSRQAQRTAQDSELFHEIGLIAFVCGNGDIILL